MDETILDPEISIQGYSIVRLDHTRHGGGALVYVKNLFIYSPLYLGTPAFECIILSLNCSCQNRASPDFTIALFYRPPSSSVSYLDNLFTVLCNINVSLFSNFVLLGDFNINYFCTQPLLFSKLMSIFSSFNLVQVVSEATRVTENSCTLIDLVFVSCPSQVLSCDTIPPLSNSDHYGLQLKLYVKAPKRQKKSSLQKIWRYAHANYDAISDSVNEVNWDLLLSGNVDTCWANWKTCMFHGHHLTIKPNYRVPWIGKCIIQAMRKGKASISDGTTTVYTSEILCYRYFVRANKSFSMTWTQPTQKDSGSQSRYAE